MNSLKFTLSFNVKQSLTLTKNFIIDDLSFGVTYTIV